eukprot:TRINITY_DN9691_c0_g2_i1.p1 TRINITY_DN9691_c0_g2~~TRINITY_DN9691_c0_g2_i1.p1  ORF type:complete len:203 (-),score=65.78 TRINITY_DN9691_c0_g2_i1:9-617(-)
MCIRDRMDSKDFQEAIDKWDKESQQTAFDSLVEASGNVSFRNTAVVIRMRPLFPHEQDRGEFPVVTCMPSHGDIAGAAVHQCGEHIIAGRGMVKHLGHHVYPCQKVFDEHTPSEEVYQECGAPLLEHCAQGGVATCFMYGQTGSGKTHTMTAIQQCVANEIFDMVEEAPVWLCLLYTSDAADDLLCVALVGRLILKNKKLTD